MENRQYGKILSLILLVCSLSLVALVLASCGTPAPASSPMIEGEATPAPSGYIDYCGRHPAECSPSSASASEIDRGQFEQLIEVHRKTISSTRYVSDQEQYGRKEYWTLPTDAGDCEDMVLAMRHDLIERGWPRSALRMSMAVTEKGQSHLVLVVTTGSGDYVLDNRQKRVLPWSALPYAWVKRQGPDLANWTLILESETPDAAAR